MSEGTLQQQAKDKFGNVLFGQVPPLAKLQGAELELDTDYEKRIYKELEKFVSAKDFNVKKLTDFLKDLKNYEDIYPKILKNVHSPLYRTTLIKEEKLESLITKLKYSPFKDGDTDYDYFSCKTIYSPRREIQHWSTTKNVIGFAGNYSSPDDDGYRVIYETKNNDNFVFNPKAIGYDYDGERQYEEGEVIRIGKLVKCEIYVPVSSIKEYYENTWDDNVNDIPDIEEYIDKEYND